MTHRGFSAQSTVFLLLATLAAAASGCQRLPIRTIESPDEKPLKSTVTGALGDPKIESKPAELPPLPAVPLDSKKPEEAAPAATPLLDAAISRANHLEQVAREPEPNEANEPNEAEVPDLKPAPRAPQSQPKEKGEREPGVAEAPPDKSDPPKSSETALSVTGPVELPPLSAPPVPIAKSNLSAGGLFEEARIETPPPAAVPLSPSGPRDDWNEGLERLRELARVRAGQPGDDAEAWAIRARLLDHLAGADDPDGANGEAWSSVLVALSTATSAETPDQALLSLRLIEAVDALELLEPLRITEFVLCRKVLGFGAFETVDPMTIRSGQSVIIYCELSGLRYAFEDGSYRSRITSKLELVKGEGGQVVWSQSLGSADDLCRRRRRDYYVNYRIALPSSLPPGPYRLRLTQNDLVGQQTTDAELRVALHSEVTPGIADRYPSSVRQ